MSPRIVCIDGNIAAGKSTVLNELESRGYVIFKERMSEWSWCLKLFDVDPERWTFTLQMAILHSMATMHVEMKSVSSNLVFIERSPESGMIFARNSFDLGNISSNEMNLLKNFYDMFGWNPTSTIKLNTPAEICFERMKLRNRDCEQQVSLEYIRDLEKGYKTLVCDSIDTENKSPQEIADSIEEMCKRFPPIVTANQQFCFDEMYFSKSLGEWIRLVHKDLSEKSGWGPIVLKPGMFGFDNIAMSIGFAFGRMIENEFEHLNRDEKLELIADRVHEGWRANYIFWRDNKPSLPYKSPASPLGDDRRNNLSVKTFAQLPENEKEKDLIIARFLLEGETNRKF